MFAQAFFAGALILISNDWRPWHIGIGHLLSSPVPLLPLLMIIMSFVGRLPRADKLLTLLLFVLALLQPFMIFFKGPLPLLGALHSANALLLFVLPLWLIARVRQVMREPAEPSASKLSYHVRAAWQMVDGRMLFGGANGLTAFQPEQIGENPYQPRMVLTSCQMFR